MKVIALKFENYRNLKDNIITPCDGVNIIYGDNAQGKTNLLEALWFFCGGHSFRGSKDSEIINWDENFARIEMRFLGQEREQTAKILFRGGKKSVEINGVQKNSAAALIERFCAVVFSPEHLSLIKRGPGERRKFIDSAICREKLKNAVVLSKYNRILNQRNSLLKDIYRRPSLADTLPVWDEPLLKSGAMLVKNRIDYVKMLSDRAVEYHNGISKGKEELKIRYVSGYEASEDDTVGEIYEKLKCKLEKHKSDDIRTGFTNYGPHRDDIEIIINGKNARAFASQGQQRSAVLSLKLAEASVLRERMGEEPVILLDDVLSELDAKRQDFLLNELHGCQVFITCCEKSNKEQLKDGKIFLLNNGEVS
ncbi:DNA replication/repair protein RecF [Ruminococcus sp. AF37-3AC]|nr:DNA replication/repair protein RecF [Ruminococcus sp. AF37-3AC]RGF41085.1 DNA replication/repair protein RecF [Ruminococcus sp. AF37-3AC]